MSDHHASSVFICAILPWIVLAPEKEELDENFFNFLRSIMVIRLYNNNYYTCRFSTLPIAVYLEGKGHVFVYVYGTRKQQQAGISLQL